MDRPKKELYTFCYGIKQQGQKHSECKCKRYCPAEYNLYKCLGKLKEWHEMKAKEVAELRESYTMHEESMSAK
jgi:hypothetical protein